MAKQPQRHIFMPNEIFNDLKTNIDKVPHIAFSYAYYYFICYLYRYCEYEGITQSTIKEKLGYNSNEKRVDYLIKKNGILDSIGYTETTSDFPLSWNTDEDGFIHFHTLEDFKKEDNTLIISDKNFKVKYPMKVFHRTEESRRELLLDGTLYDVSNTHCIDYKVFERFMRSEALGCMAFYIYGYLHWKTNMLGNYRIPSRMLSDELGISEPTLFKYTNAMEEAKILQVVHQKFVGVGGKSNIYKTLV